MTVQCIFCITPAAISSGKKPRLGTLPFRRLRLPKIKRVLMNCAPLLAITNFTYIYYHIYMYISIVIFYKILLYFFVYCIFLRQIPPVTTLPLKHNHLMTVYCYIFYAGIAVLCFKFKFLVLRCEIYPFYLMRKLYL